MHCFTEEWICESLLLNAKNVRYYGDFKKYTAPLMVCGNRWCASFVRGMCCSKRKAYWTTLIYQDLNEAKLFGILSSSAAQYCCRKDKHVNNILTDTLSSSLYCLYPYQTGLLLFFRWMYFRLAEFLLPWIIFHIRF